MLKEFKPALLFLGKFLAIYFFGNVIYGLYVEAFGEKPDTITTWVTEQSALVLQLVGFNTATLAHEILPKVGLVFNGDPSLYVYEGCNGLNVMIIFVAFVMAYSGKLKNMLIFIPAGIVGIHLFNILRIALLFLVVENYPDYMYYAHKYIFTVVIYLFVFALWYLWVARLSE